MDLRLRWKLKGLPIWKPEINSLRSAMVTFITIAEQSATGAKALEAALSRLSDDEFDKYSQPGAIHSTSEAISFCSSKSAQSSQYQWKQQDNCLVLLSKSKFSEMCGMPGVIYEFLIRTGRSSWTVYRVPDPREILDFAMYFERNELVTHSQRPSKLSMRARREQFRFRLAKIPKAIALALSPSTVRES